MRFLQIYLNSNFKKNTRLPGISLIYIILLKLFFKYIFVVINMNMEERQIEKEKEMAEKSFIDFSFTFCTHQTLKYIGCKISSLLTCLIW